ncbi:hypothetical protein FDA09_06720 [Clostridium botulinum]|uniref:hypothetical protein n=1 Tax=Clostridium botulinum TaxID=1491 RepID=UPI000773DB19|nr:hypothetical protein [Clostridium botulinum]NFH79094.1 hypothetical protein [Clostridium botulinum]NFH82656.1 hypothetical protein [Clostridium botulinum]NFI11085.1 hypothetical protein [Clostridium botulinum]NFI13909.1 hypothetical protein [Clostridium botulinum]NFO83358.1 hypothetical protein [Clostridium botulinum]
MLNKSRWNRLKDMEIDFNYIKRLTKKYFDYEIREGCIDDFCKCIVNYKEIDETDLLNVLEKNAYTRLSVLSMRALVKQPTYPIHNELTNEAFKDLFKQRNRINTKNGQYYKRALDECYKITYYNEIDTFIEIKISRIKKITQEVIIEPGVTSTNEIDIYDCCKFIIDLDKKLVFMFYNDVHKSNINQSKEVAEKKKAFYNLFTKATQGNVLSYSISDSLNKYFLEYMKELDVGIPKKIISIVETSKILPPKKATRSTAVEYVHEKETIDAMRKYVLSKKYAVSLLECKINSELIKLKNTADVFAESAILSGEVFENVCKEFFNGHKIYELCTQ